MKARAAAAKPVTDCATQLIQLSRGSAAEKSANAEQRISAALSTRSVHSKMPWAARMAAWMAAALSASACGHFAYGFGNDAPNSASALMAGAFLAASLSRSL